jgi:DNA-binding MarR family transcriptional regulator
MSSATRIDPATCARIAATCGFFRMRRAARVVAKRIDAAFEAEALKPTQLFILLGLNLTGGTKVQDLADLLGLDHSTLSRTLVPLRAKGWIRQAAAPDARATPLALTDTGRRQAERAIGAWERFQRDLEGSVGSTRWARLSADLDAVIALDAPEVAQPKAKARPKGRPRRS